MNKCCHAWFPHLPVLIVPNKKASGRRWRWFPLLVLRWASPLGWAFCFQSSCCNSLDSLGPGTRRGRSNIWRRSRRMLVVTQALREWGRTENAYTSHVLLPLSALPWEGAAKGMWARISKCCLQKVPLLHIKEFWRENTFPATQEVVSVCFRLARGCKLSSFCFVVAKWVFPVCILSRAPAKQCSTREGWLGTRLTPTLWCVVHCFMF